MKMKTKSLLMKLKIKCFDLYRFGMLPKILYDEILNLGVDTPVNVVQFYMELTQQFMRVKGFYKSHKEIHDMTNDEINKIIEEYQQKQQV